MMGLEVRCAHRSIAVRHARHVTQIGVAARHLAVARRDSDYFLWVEGEDVLHASRVGMRVSQPVDGRLGKDAAPVRAWAIIATWLLRERGLANVGHIVDGRVARI